MRVTVMLLSAMLVTGCASAQPVDGQVPPPDTAMSATWPATLHEAPATQLALGSLDVRFGHTTLDEVLTATGVGKLQHEGDAGDSRTWLCYITPPHQGRVVRLWLVSGEIDGGKYVTGVSAKQVSPDTGASDACPELPVPFARIALDNRVWLGMSEKELTNRMEKASHVSGDWRMFDYARTFKADSCVQAEQSSSLWVRLSDGHVEEVQAYQTETC